jgi:hypothetical protein
LLLSTLSNNKYNDITLPGINQTVKVFLSTITKELTSHEALLAKLDDLNQCKNTLEKLIIIIEKTINGLIETGMLVEGDRSIIETTHVLQADYAYPVPTLERNEALEVIQPYLESQHISVPALFGVPAYQRARSSLATV